MLRTFSRYVSENCWVYKRQTTQSKVPEILGAKANRMKIPDENFSKMFSGSTLREFDLFSENFGSCHFNRHWKFRRMPFQSILEIQIKMEVFLV